MANSNAIKTDLFRFVSLRGPQIISHNRRKAGFIRHPNANHSFFLTELSSAETLSQLREVLYNRIQDFQELRSVAEVRRVEHDGVEDLNPVLYKFSTWLMQNRSQLTLEVAEAKTQNLKPLTENQKLILWDNVFYDLLELKSKYIRQACIQLIVANNFLEKLDAGNIPDKALEQIEPPKRIEPYSDEEIIDLYIQRVANAKLIVPKFESIDRIDKSENLTEVPQLETEDKFMQVMHRNMAHEYQDYSSDLLALHTQHTAAFSLAVQEDDARRKRLYSRRQASVRRKFKESSTEELEAHLAEVEYPEQRIEIPKLLSLEFSKGKLTEKTQAFLDRHELRDHRLSEVLKKTSQLKKKALKKYPVKHKQKKRVSIARVPITPELREKYSFTFGFKLDDKSGETGIAVLVINTHDTDVHIVGATYRLTLLESQETIESGAIVNASAQTDTFFTAHLFDERYIELQQQQGLYKFDGQFQLSNDKRLEIHFTSHVNNLKKSGKSLVDGGDANIPDLYGVHRIGIADYFKVEQELCCYLPGEVSHIENIMAREYKERSTRSLTSTEDRVEDRVEIEQESLTDNATTQRNEIATEIASTFASENSRNVGFNTDFNFQYGTEAGPSIAFNIGANMDFASSNSTSTSNTLARKQAQEVTERALERVIQKVSTTRTSVVKKEFEETNRHGFDNKGGNRHVSGVYRWVDKIYTNRLINYGNRLMYEFMIPEPSYLYKHAIAEAVQAGETIPPESTGGTPPGETPDPIDDLETLEIIEGEIDYEKARIAADYYVQKGAVLEAPIINLGEPLIERDILLRQQSSENNDFDEEYEPAFDFTQNPLNHRHLKVPPNYEVFRLDGDYAYPGAPSLIRTNAEFTLEYKRWLSDTNREITLEVGQQPHHIDFRNTDGEQTTLNFWQTFDLNEFPYRDANNVESFFPIKASGMGFQDLTIRGTLHLRLNEDIVNQWQEDTYDILLKAYNDAVAIQEAQQAFEEPLDTAPLVAEEEPVKVNPQFNREIEQRELKRLAIEMLTRPFGKPMGGKFYQPGDECNLDGKTYNIPHVDQTLPFERYGSHVKFFEQAFDWKLMSYIFYPYYWADKCQWRDLIRTSDGDQMFQAFLRSGMARMVVPVTLGFEEAVTYYINSGDIWNGKDLVVDSDDDLYISIVDELTAAKGIVEDEWETRVPTALTVIQSDSVALNASGLPCCDSHQGPEPDENQPDGEPTHNDRIVQSLNKLTGAPENPAE